MLTCCTCGCAPTVCWAKGFVAFLPVLRSPAGSGSAGSCGFSSPIWFTTFAMGSPVRGRGWFVLDWNEGLVCFLFPFWAVSSCCHCPSGYNHRMGQVCWSVPTYARPTVVVGASPFLLLDGLRPLSEASLRALSLQANFLVALAEAESLLLSLALSSVLPCPMFKLHVRLHDTCSQTKVVLGALP